MIVQVIDNSSPRFRVWVRKGLPKPMWKFKVADDPEMEYDRQRDINLTEVEQ